MKSSSNPRSRGLNVPAVFSRVANLTRVQYAGAILVHRAANKVDKSADFCPQMGNEHPQRAGKNASQAKFAILEKKDCSSPSHKEGQKQWIGTASCPAP